VPPESLIACKRKSPPVAAHDPAHRAPSSSLPPSCLAREKEEFEFELLFADRDRLPPFSAASQCFCPPVRAFLIDDLECALATAPCSRFVATTTTEKLRRELAPLHQLRCAADDDDVLIEDLTIPRGVGLVDPASSR
jgi:hypothetical protein